ncbi:MAG: DUF624 domain-containing protein [Solibacillus sp.]
MKHTFSKLYIACEWVMNLLLLNVLFIFFSFAGLVIFGISPAMTAMSSVFKLLYEGQDVRVIRTFYQIFRREFVQSNKIGLLYGYLLGMLFLNFLFIQTLPPSVQTIAMLCLLLLTLLTGCSLLYVWPLHTSFKSTVRLLIKNSFILAFAFLPRTFFALCAIGCIVVICLYEPVLIFLLGFSSICAITIINSEHCLKKIQFQS